MKTLTKIYIVMILGLSYLNAGDFLMPDQAFKPYAKINDKTEIEAGSCFR